MRKKAVLVTGCNGMIGSYAVKRFLGEGHYVVGIDKTPKELHSENYTHCQMELRDANKLEEIFAKYRPTHAVHLAALAHTGGETDLSWERFKHENVECAENVFECALRNSTPVLFASTVDVYGIPQETVTVRTECRPVTNYAKSKYLAEAALSQIFDGAETPYAIFRFAPVYTEDVKRDIQKRYYLKYPSLAYRVGKGMEYEVLSIENAVTALAGWVENSGATKIENVKDDKLLLTAAVISEEKKAGRARFVLWMPYWMAAAGYSVMKAIFGANNAVFLLSKVVHPLRTE